MRPDLPDPKGVAFSLFRFRKFLVWVPLSRTTTLFTVLVLLRRTWAGEQRVMMQMQTQGWFTSIMLLALHKHHNSIVHTEYGCGPTCSLQRVTHPPCSLQGLNPAIGSPRSEVHGRCDGQPTLSSANDSHSLTINEDHTLTIKTSSSSAKPSGSAQGFRRLDGDGDGGACGGGTSAGASTAGTSSTVFARSS